MATEEAKNPPAEGAKKSRLRVIVGAVLVVGVGAVIGWYVLHAGRESTDDSQVEADVVAVPARTGGVITKVDFLENQEVKEGAVLVEIDSAPQAAKLAAAEADLAQAKASVAAADAQRRQAEQDLE